ncbi:hypothetical protein K9M48_01205 [Candidatus Gracilibacteria bacterium]|nr:hypothetical protein [Candidatus Gracilibacteria bacterium]
MTQTISCQGLPTNASWNITDQIIQNRNGIGRIPNNQGTYDLIPSTTECRFKCDYGYSRYGTSCKIDVQPIQCQGLPTNASWNTVSQINQTRNGTIRTPSNIGTYNSTSSTTECRFKCQTNYTRDQTSNSCIPTTVDAACQGLPTNASWNTVAQVETTRNGTTRTPSNIGTYNLTPSTTECRFKCQTNYTRDGTSNTCKATIQTGQCQGLPTNASWNTVSQINQTRNGTIRTPSNIGIYNTNSSTTECRFKCNSGFNWDPNTNSCGAPSSQPVACQGLPTNAIWNTTPQITSTRNGTTRTPSNIGTYNLTPSTTECRFKCQTNYTRDGNSNSCVPNTQTGQCQGLPTNGIRNTVSRIIQTRNGASWQPSTNGTQINRPSTTECRFKCNTGYTGIGCNTPGSKTALCGPKPINGSFTDPICLYYDPGGDTCVITQTRLGTSYTGSWAPTTGSYYHTTPLTNSCRFNCKAGYVRDGNSCIPNYKIVNCTSKPANSMWNGIPIFNGSNPYIYQTRTGGSGGYYTPSNVSFYSSTAISRNLGCPFKCNPGYIRNQNSCISNSTPSG